MIKNSILIAAVSLIYACSVPAIKEQANTIESLVAVSGTVRNSVGDEGTIFVKIYSRQPQGVHYHSQIAVQADGSFKFSTPAEQLILVAYIDVDGDRELGSSEPAAYLSETGLQPLVIDLASSGDVEGAEIVITGKPFVMKQSLVGEDDYKINKNIGKVVSIDDAMFARENADMGLWRPIDFISDVGGGLLMLQEYDAAKQPIIFVHGIGGTPIEFKQAIAELDKTRYQPWVLFYPSGFRLDIISDYFIRAMSQLHDQYRFDSVVLVAHSMGGLMSRSFLMKYEELSPEYKITKHITINSPLYGMASANSGVNYSPVVVPVWRDVASDSDYVKKVHQWKMPESIPYYLFFSYLSGEEGDGVVPLVSQLSLSLQDEAEAIVGFNAQHAGVLKDEDFIKRLNIMLAN